MQYIYTFYLNDSKAEDGIWSCVAESEDEAFGKALEYGLADFFLSNIEDVPRESTREVALTTMLENPNLGPIWLPIAEALEQLNAQLNPKARTWSVNTLMRVNDYSPDDSPYTQAILESDGSLHVEVSGKLANVNMSTENLQLLDMIGWQVPGVSESQPDEEPGLPNPYRVFKVGWGGLQVATFVLETLITVYGFQDGDFFDFSSLDDLQALADKEDLERVPIHEGNPLGSIFRLIQQEQHVGGTPS